LTICERRWGSPKNKNDERGRRWREKETEYKREMEGGGKEKKSGGGREVNLGKGRWKWEKENRQEHEGGIWRERGEGGEKPKTWGIFSRRTSVKS